MTKEPTYKRVITGTDVKYRLIDTYRDIGVYEEISNSGYRISQSWLLVDQHLYIFIDSYNHYCKEELLDAIDERKENGKFGFKGFMRLTGFVVHPNGKDTL